MIMKKYPILFCAPFLLFSINSFADTYQRCSEQQQDQITQKFKLLSHKFDNTEAQTFISCLNLDTVQNIQLIAVSQPIAYQARDEIEHDLNLYLIDSSKNKMLQRYKDPMTYTSDADHFDGVKLDINRFSTLPNTHVVGVETGSSHEGGFTYRYNNLALLKIDPKQPIKEIFSGIGTDDSGYERIGTCTDNTNSHVKRILILSKNLSHGLQDIIMKETKDQTKTDYRNCKSVKRQYKQQQVIKFNGKEYKLQHDRLLGIDAF